MPSIPDVFEYANSAFVFHPELPTFSCLPPHNPRINRKRPVSSHRTGGFPCSRCGKIASLTAFKPCHWPPNHDKMTLYVCCCIENAITNDLIVSESVWVATLGVELELVRCLPASIVVLYVVSFVCCDRFIVLPVLFASTLSVFVLHIVSFVLRSRYSVLSLLFALTLDISLISFLQSF